MRVLGGDLGMGDGPPALTVVYAAPRALSRDAATLLARAAAQSVGVPPAGAQARWVRLGSREVPRDPAAALRLARGLAETTKRYPELGLVLRADSLQTTRLRPTLDGLAEQLTVRPDSASPRLVLRLR